MPSGDGYRHNSDALTAVSGHWRDGANQLDAAALPLVAILVWARR